MKMTTPEVIQTIKQQLEAICRAAEKGMGEIEDTPKFRSYDGSILDRIARDIVCMANVIKDLAYDLETVGKKEGHIRMNP